MPRAVAMPAATGLTFAQHHFQFQEMAKARHVVQVDARCAKHEEKAPLPDAAGKTQRRSERVAQKVRRGRGHDCVARLLGPGRVGTLVEDELALGRGQFAQLEASPGACEESVILDDLHGTVVGDGLRPCEQCGGVGHPRLDLDVAGHARQCGGGRGPADRFSRRHPRRCADRKTSPTRPKSSVNSSNRWGRFAAAKSRSPGANGCRDEPLKNTPWPRATTYSSSCVCGVCRSWPRGA